MTIDPKKIVLEWIAEHFEEDSIDCTDFPMYLGGKLVKDCDNDIEMVVFYDFVKNKVDYLFQGDGQQQ